jgi:hypothetical protein
MASKKLNDKQALILALESLYQELHSKSNKYRVFQREDGQRYYVGNAGALRLGLTVAASQSFTDHPRKKRFVELGHIISKVSGGVNPDQARELYSTILALAKQGVPATI